MTLTTELKQRIISTINQYTDKANRIFNTSISYPNVIFTKRGTTAGTANYASHTININPELYIRNVDSFLTDTAPHELSHLVAYQVYSKGRGVRIQPHGDEWKRVMRSLGVTPSRCHSYDTSEVKQKKVTTQYQYKCGCRNDLMLSAQRHHKVLKGAKFHCVKCKQNIVYVGNVPAATPINVSKPVTPTTTSNGTKKQQSQQIYNSFKHLGRTAVIALFKSRLNMSDAGASTYWYNCTRGK